MPECGYCRWWLSGKNDYPPNLTEWGQCGFAAGIYGLAVHDESLAYSVDLDGNGTALLAKPDFGCVQWEAND